MAKNTFCNPGKSDISEREMLGLNLLRDGTKKSQIRVSKRSFLLGQGQGGSPISAAMGYSFISSQTELRELAGHHQLQP